MLSLFFPGKPTLGSSWRCSPPPWNLSHSSSSWRAHATHFHAAKNINFLSDSARESFIKTRVKNCAPKFGPKFWKNAHRGLPSLPSGPRSRRQRRRRPPCKQLFCSYGLAIVPPPSPAIIYISCLLQRCRGACTLSKGLISYIQLARV